MFFTSLLRALCLVGVLVTSFPTTSWAQTATPPPAAEATACPPNGDETLSPGLYAYVNHLSAAVGQGFVAEQDLVLTSYCINPNTVVEFDLSFYPVTVIVTSGAFEVEFSDSFAGDAGGPVMISRNDDPAIPEVLSAPSQNNLAVGDMLVAANAEMKFTTGNSTAEFIAFGFVDPGGPGGCAPYCGPIPVRRP